MLLVLMPRVLIVVRVWLSLEDLLCARLLPWISLPRRRLTWDRFTRMMMVILLPTLRYLNMLRSLLVRPRMVRVLRVVVVVLCWCIRLFRVCPLTIICLVCVIVSLVRWL